MSNTNSGCVSAMNPGMKKEDFILWESNRSRILGDAIEGPYSLIDSKVGKFLDAGFLLMVPLMPSRSKLITIGQTILLGQVTISCPFTFPVAWPLLHCNF